MKLILTILLYATLTCPAQFYQLSTNLMATNTIAASSTNTYLGTNYLDVSRHRSIGITARFWGSNTNTNTATFTFLAGATPTNWETLPRLALTLTSYGTNYSEQTTNVDVLGIGYLKPFQILNTCTNSLTNSWQYGQLKDFPRN